MTTRRGMLHNEAWQASQRGVASYTYTTRRGMLHNEATFPCIDRAVWEKTLGIRM